MAGKELHTRWCKREILRWKCGGGDESAFSTAGAVAGAGKHELQKVAKNEEVDDQKADANPGNAAEDLEHLPGQERGGDGKGKEFAPGLFEIEADAFSQRDAGICEGDKADAAQSGVVDEGGLIKDEVDEARFGIEAEMTGEEVDLVGNVFVEQAVRAEADGEKQEGLDEFVDRDENQQPVMALAAGLSFGMGSRHETDRLLSFKGT